MLKIVQRFLLGKLSTICPSTPNVQKSGVVVISYEVVDVFQDPGPAPTALVSAAPFPIAPVPIALVPIALTQDPGHRTQGAPRAPAPAQAQAGELTILTVSLSLLYGKSRDSYLFAPFFFFFFTFLKR
ncbi:Protein CBG27453 [Caenorhabditis briggsae]|uniref:Protein CBG27453 n=1 Tax=Caenorhabditis briggsae TaxID=6238 RepID=B6IK30_CAEBR|nr:Protein CBG27453 [Caenorhabditis briggsae]CAS00260.1 Protein CBG27453 [Caenorhabditis briggsae]